MGTQTNLEATKFCLLRYVLNTEQSLENQRTYRRNMSPLPSGGKKKPNKKRKRVQVAFNFRGFFLGLFLYPEDEDEIFLRNDS
jgi:hypothetical protein